MCYSKLLWRWVATKFHSGAVVCTGGGRRASTRLTAHSEETPHHEYPINHVEETNEKGTTRMHVQQGVLWLIS